MAADIESALNLLPGIGNGGVVVSRSGESYTIAFIGSSFAGKNIKPIAIVDTSGLTVQDTVQSGQLIDATGGTFTLTLHANGHNATTGALAFNPPANNG